MGTTWRPRGDHLVTTWRPHGDHVAATRGPRGGHMVTTRRPNGDHLAATPGPRGGNMGITGRRVHCSPASSWTRPPAVSALTETEWTRRIKSHLELFTDLNVS